MKRLQNSKIFSFLIIFIQFSQFCNGIYTNEAPVKLLQVESLADRYPASESEYRKSVTNGYVRKS